MEQAVLDHAVLPARAELLDELEKLEFEFGVTVTTDPGDFIYGDELSIGMWNINIAC